MKARKLAACTLVAALATFSLAPSASSAHKDAPAYLGVRLQRIEGGLAEALDMEEDTGVLVGQVLEDSPARKAGLEEGDIVLRADGKDVKQPNDLRRILRRHDAGEEIELTIRRDGKEKTLTAELAQKPRHPFRCQLSKVRALGACREHGFLGVRTQPLTGDLGEYFGVEEQGGALVTEVVEDSPAEKLGLKAGDVIVEVGGEPIQDPGELRRVVSHFEEEAPVEVVWVRDGKRRKGEATLELRKGPLAGVPGEFEWRDLVPHPDFDFPRPDIRRFRERIRMHKPQEEGFLHDALRELREQLRELRDELAEMREEMESD